MRRPAAPPLARRALLAVAATAVLAACASDPAPPPTAEAPTTPSTAVTTTTEPATTTTAPPTPEQEVEAAVTEAESQFWLALQRPSTGADHLAEWFSGEALKGVSEAVQSLEREGLASDGDGPQPTLTVSSVEVTGERATATVCIVDPQVIRSTTDGSISNDDVRSRKYEFTVELSTQWKISQMVVLDDWADIGGCDR